jgi:pimeloyl-ACP methyl ester carboxylesterase
MKCRLYYCLISIFVIFSVMKPNDTIAQASGAYALVNGISMYYETVGAGRPLVLIHGGGSTIRTSFGKIMPLLATGHRVIAVELQAHGHTEDRNTPSSFEQDADDVAALLDQLHITAADIIGFSNGGNTAMQLASRHPAAVRAMVIASTFYKKKGLYDWLWEGMAKASLHDMPQAYQDAYLQINPGKQAGLEALHNRDAVRMQSFTDWSDELIRSISIPVLVVAGDQDVVRPEHAVEMYRLLPKGRLAIFPANHGSYMGELMSPNPQSRVPELFTAMVEEFLAAPEPGR